MHKKWCFPEEKKIRLIICSDTKNEADDQFAIVHHLLSPKFEIKGLIAGHFENRGNGEYNQVRNIPEFASMNESYYEIKKILKIMNMEDQYKVYKGAIQALENEKKPKMSDGAEFIIREALKNDSRPLFAVFLGSLTDLASAYLIEPKIIERLNVVWIGGGKWPEGGVEYNLMQDVLAANIVFSSKLELWQIPMDVYQKIQVTFTELEMKVFPCGEIGKYLFEQLIEFNQTYAKYLPDRQGDTWVLGDQPTASVFFDANQNAYDVISAPNFTEDMKYIHHKKNRPIRVYNNIDSRLTLEDFYAKLWKFSLKNKETNK